MLYFREPPSRRERTETEDCSILQIFSRNAYPVQRSRVEVANIPRLHGEGEGRGERRARKTMRQRGGNFMSRRVPVNATDLSTVPIPSVCSPASSASISARYNFQKGQSRRCLGALSTVLPALPPPPPPPSRPRDPLRFRDFSR